MGIVSTRMGLAARRKYLAAIDGKGKSVYFVK